jgi:hypothetical protein
VRPEKRADQRPERRSDKPVDRSFDKRGLRERLATSVVELDALRLQERWSGVEVTPIGELEERRPVRFGGEVRTQHRSGHGDLPILRVTISDGSGQAVLVFTGRSHLGGVQSGRALLAEGVGRREGSRFVVRNPAYTLLP